MEIRSREVPWRRRKVGQRKEGGIPGLSVVPREVSRACRSFRVQYSWEEVSFCSGIPHGAWSTEPRLARFFYIDLKRT